MPHSIHLSLMQLKRQSYLYYSAAPKAKAAMV